jgi:hypothetical protein
MIRLAMLAGVLIFGGVVWWQRREGGGSVPDAAFAKNLRTLAIVWIAVAVTGIAALFAFVSRQLPEERRRMFSILAWALGEGAALAGGVVYLLAGDARWYLAGVFVLLVAFIVFPARRRD